jgi:hypothetical protein
VLHSFSAESDLSLARKARPVGYAWLPATKTDLEESFRQESYDCIAIQIEELFDALRRGVAQFFYEVQRDSGRLKAVSVRASTCLRGLDKRKMDLFLAFKKQAPK